MQPVRQLRWTAEVVPLVLDVSELECARRFLNGNARIAATQDGATTVEFLCHGPAAAEEQARKLHIALLDTRQRAALAVRPGRSAAQAAARLIALAAGT